MNRRIKLRTLGVCAALWALSVCLPTASAAPPTREALRHPVYRIQRGPSPYSTIAAAGPEERITGHEPIKSAEAALPVGHGEADRSGTSDILPSAPEPRETAPAEVPSAGHAVAAIANDTAAEAGVSKVASNVPLPMPVKSAARQTLDRALADAEVVLAHLRENVRDYSCEFIKRERVDGELLASEQMLLKVRNRCVRAGQNEVPLSVYMKFLGPSECRNREVLFVEGQNNNKLLAKEGGSKKWLPSVWLNIDGSFAMQTNRYPITEVGLVRLTERLLESGRRANVDACKIRYLEGAKVDGHSCNYLEVLRPTKLDAEISHDNIYLAQVFIDQERKLPIRYAAYDWPEQPGGRPRLLEEYTYRNIQVNLGLTDQDFDHKNPTYGF